MPAVNPLDLLTRDVSRPKIQQTLYKLTALFPESLVYDDDEEEEAGE